MRQRGPASSEHPARHLGHLGDGELLSLGLASNKLLLQIGVGFCCGRLREHERQQEGLGT